MVFWSLMVCIGALRCALPKGGKKRLSGTTIKTNNSQTHQSRYPTLTPTEHNKLSTAIEHFILLLLPQVELRGDAIQRQTSRGWSQEL